MNYSQVRVNKCRNTVTDNDKTNHDNSLRVNAPFIYARTST